MRLETGKPEVALPLVSLSPTLHAVFLTLFQPYGPGAQFAASTMFGLRSLVLKRANF